jgi:tetratricopeptide (TPR) repeat protein
MLDRFEEVKRLVQADDLDEACEWLQAFVREHPDDPQALLNLSIVLIGLGKPDQAFAAQKRAFEIDPNCSAEFGKHSVAQENKELSDQERAALLEAIDLVSGGLTSSRRPPTQPVGSARPKVSGPRRGKGEGQP